MVRFVFCFLQFDIVKHMRQDQITNGLVHAITSVINTILHFLEHCMVDCLVNIFFCIFLLYIDKFKSLN